MSVKRIHELLEQGFSLTEAQEKSVKEERGEDWEQRYPYLATWPGTASFTRRRVENLDLEWSFSAGLRSGSVQSYQSINYEILDVTVPASTECTLWGLADSLIETWWLRNGPKVANHFRTAWNRDEGWSSKYPHLYAWINFGKRHCVTINLSEITQQGHVKSWHFDKLANQETVIFEADFFGLPEAEILHALDDGIALWQRENLALWGRLSIE